MSKKRRYINNEARIDYEDSRAMLFEDDKGRVKVKLTLAGLAAKEMATAEAIAINAIRTYYNWRIKKMDTKNRGGDDV